MVEGFTLLAKELKRKLKIITSLPADYYTAKRQYPLVILFDGDYFFSYLDEKFKKFDMNEQLEKLKSDFIVASLFAPRIEEWRTSELNPYYNGKNETVDKSLAPIYFDYITKNVLPLLKEKYRLTDNVYLMGMHDACIAVSSMIYKYDEYKGAILLSPSFIDTDKQIYEDIKEGFKKEKSIYLYMGQINTSVKDLDCIYNLEKTLSNADNYVCEFEAESDNSYDTIIKHLENSIKIVSRR